MGKEKDPASEQQKNGLAQVDPCTMVSPEVLASFGLRGPGEPETGNSSEPGCYFPGDPISGTFYKNQEKTVAAYGAQQSTWAKFDPLQVDGRSAASAVANGSTQAGVCSTLFDTGGGVIILTVSNKGDNAIDPCAKSLKIAEAIAPRMPR
ncbi:DUF3558 family protein [Saccharopolyspora shandongensis]|uniref:DUF3558 family protein n=1 Tax=Saccharopolyspora shandongensis TaxID=418495 RepID=UPI0033E3740B